MKFSLFYIIGNILAISAPRLDRTGYRCRQKYVSKAPGENQFPGAIHFFWINSALALSPLQLNFFIPAHRPFIIITETFVFLSFIDLFVQWHVGRSYEVLKDCLCSRLAFLWIWSFIVGMGRGLEVASRYWRPDERRKDEVNYYYIITVF